METGRRWLVHPFLFTLASEREPAIDWEHEEARWVPPNALADYETALVYLTMADMKLGRVGDARAALRQISIAERIEPTYQALPLDADAAEFEPIAHQLLPEMPLPPNQALAEIRSGKHRRSDVA